MTKPPVWLSVPPMTLPPALLRRPASIRRSPSIRRASRGLRRSTPSTGTFSPGRTRSRSPTATLSIATSSSAPSAPTRRAVFGARSSSARIAPRGRLAGAQFEHLAEQHQHGDHRRGLEIDRHRAAMAAERRREELRRQRRDDAVDVGDAGAHRDQREHVEIARDAATASRARRTASRPTARPASRARAGSSSTTSGSIRP